MDVCRVLLRYSAQLHDTSDSACDWRDILRPFTCKPHYCQRTNYRVQTLEATKLVDTDTQVVLDLHCTTTRPEAMRKSVSNSPAHLGELRISC